MHSKILQRPDRAARTDISGLLAGTTLLTMDGELPVDHLSPGDRIITRDSGMAILRGIEMHEVTTQTIAIKPGSLGHTRPDRRAEVLPATKLLIRDWRAPALFGMKDALVPAERLIDGSFIAAQPARKHRIYTLTLDADHILYADGLEVSTAS